MGNDTVNVRTLLYGKIVSLPMARPHQAADGAVTSLPMAHRAINAKGLPVPRAPNCRTPSTSAAFFFRIMVLANATRPQSGVRGSRPATSATSNSNRKREGHTKDTEDGPLRSDRGRAAPQRGRAPDPSAPVCYVEVTLSPTQPPKR